jgi:hypothetical protein
MIVYLLKYSIPVKRIQIVMAFGLLAAILILAFHERANTRFAPTMARKSSSEVGVNLVFTRIIR